MKRVSTPYFTQASMFQKPASRMSEVNKRLSHNMLEEDPEENYLFICKAKGITEKGMKFSRESLKRRKKDGAQKR